MSMEVYSQSDVNVTVTDTVTDGSVATISYTYVGETTMYNYNGNISDPEAAPIWRIFRYKITTTGGVDQSEKQYPNSGTSISYAYNKEWDERRYIAYNNDAAELTH